MFSVQQPFFADNKFPLWSQYEMMKNNIL